MTWVAGIAALIIAAQGEVTAPAAAPPETAAPVARPWERADKDVNTISVNAAGAAFGIYTAAFERVLTNSTALTIEGGWERRDVKTPRGPASADGVLLGVMLRYHPFSAAPAGLYVAPELQIINLTIVEALGGAKGTTVGGSLEIGYAVRLWSYLFVSAGLGGAVYFGPVAPLGKQVLGWGFGPLARVNVGVAF